MAINYDPTTTLVTTDFLAGTISASGQGRKPLFYPNGSSSYLIAPTASTSLYFWRFDPATTSPGSPTATFTTSANNVYVDFWANGSSSFVFTADQTSNIVSCYQFNPATVAGAIGTGSRWATFAAPANTRACTYYQDGITGYLFIATAGTTSSILLYKFDTTAGTSPRTFTTPTATFNAGYTCPDLAFYWNGANSILVTLDGTTNRINTWVIDSATISGTITTASRAGVYTVTSSTALDFYYNGANSYFLTPSSFYRTDPTTVQTLTTPTATFGSLSTPNSVTLINNGSNSYVIISNQVNSDISDINYYKIDPSTVSGSQTPSLIFRSGSNPRGADCALISGTAYLFSYYQNNIAFYRTTFNERSLGIVEAAKYSLGNSAPIRKTSGGALTLYSEIDYFVASQILRSGSVMVESGLGTTVFGFNVSTTSDTELTINEDFILSGGTAGVTGNYRITMGSSTTLTLSSKGTYSDSFTVPATGTLVIVQDTTLGEEFILSAGTTVNKSGAGPYTLTIPYPDPGLVLGSGVILSAPTSDVAAANFADGTRVQVAHRQIFSPTSADINTTSDYITIGTDSNGDSPSFSSSPRTLVRFNLVGTATIPTTSPQIIDGGLYYADLSGSNLSLRITSSGSNIDFISQGSGTFQLIAETEKDNSVVAGGSGYSYTLTLSNNALVRVKAIHWTETAGSASSTPLFDQVYAWSSTAGITVIDVVDNADPDSQDSIHEQLVAISSIQLEGQVIDNAGTPITSITLPDSGQSVTGLSFALEGVGKVQVNANDSNGILTWQELYLWGRYVQSTSAGIRISSSTTFIATNLNNYVITNLEFDNVSSSALQVVGGIGKSSDGAACVSTLTTGSVILNAVNQGTGAVITTGGSALTPTESGYLTAINTKTSELYRRQGMELGVTASEKDAETGTPGYLTTSDGLIDQTITKNIDGSVTINRN